MDRIQRGFGRSNNLGIQHSHLLLNYCCLSFVLRLTTGIARKMLNNMEAGLSGNILNLILPSVITAVLSIVAFLVWRSTLTTQTDQPLEKVRCHRIQGIPIGKQRKTFSGCLKSFCLRSLAVVWLSCNHLLGFIRQHWIYWIHLKFQRTFHI